MASFVHIFIFSYCFGLIRFRFRDAKRILLLDFLKGLICVMLSGIYVNTGLSYLVSTMGVIIGHKWPVIPAFAKRDGEAVVLGTLFAASPYMALAALSVFAAVKKVFKNKNFATVISGFILVLILLILKKPDSLIITGIFAFIVLMVQYLSRFEETNKRLVRKRAFLFKVLLIILVVVVSMLIFFNRYVYKGFGMQVDLIRNGPRELNYVALTFDDGPDPAYTPLILDILKEKDIKATFFLIGNHVSKYPYIVERMYNEGHSIGNHTNSHRSLVPLSKAATYGEIMLAEEAIESITGEKPTLFRPPRGVYSKYARELLKEKRYTIVLWDLSSQDWEEARYTDLVKGVTKKVRPGSILLFHDSGNIVSSSGGNRINTVRALPIIIDRLKDSGYSFVTVDEMIILSGLSEKEDYIFDGR